MDSDKEQGQQPNPQDISRKNPQTDLQHRQQQGSVQPDPKDHKPGQVHDEEQEKSKKTA
jgi:hypothetical protein